MSRFFEGVLSYYNRERGFGFIDGGSTGHLDEDGNEIGNIFLHAKEILDGGYVRITEGCRVRFNMRLGPKGYVATSATIVDSPEIVVPKKGQLGRRAGVESLDELMTLMHSALQKVEEIESQIMQAMEVIRG